MRKFFACAILLISLFLMISCDIELLTGEENINDYIYPYLEFTISEDESYYTAEVVEGTNLEEVYIPAFADYKDEAVPIKYFDGFSNKDDASDIKTIIFESSDTTATDKAAKETEGLVNIKIDKPAENSVWGYLPPVEKEGMEFIGWFIEGTSTQVFEGDTITNPIIEPRFRDHTLTKHEGKPATCMSSGWEEYVTCSTCSYTTYKEIPKLSHSLSHHSAVEATCTENGSREYWSCFNCNSTFSDAEGVSKIDEVVILATGHKTFHVEKVEAECGKEGKEEHWKCERCHALFSDEEAENAVSETELVIPALEHNFVRSQFSAESTCTWDECTHCHETTNPTGHSWDEGVVTVEATETSKGTMRYTCTNCSITMDEDIAPLDVTHVHNWEDKEIIQKTCTKRGYTVRECSECHISYNYNYDDAEGHKTAVVEAKDATCTEGGNSKYYQCSVCLGLFKDRNAINSTTMAEITEGKTKLGHSWSEGYETNAGGHWHTCRRCDAVSTSEKHSFTNKVETAEHLKSSATCTDSAVYYYSCACERNGSETFTSGEALGHEKTHHEGQSASCIREGYHEYWTCSRCEKSFYDEACTNEITEANKNVIPMTSHTDSGTYTTAGSKGHQKKCSYCKQGYGDYISHTVQDFEWGGNDAVTHWHICRYCEYRAGEEKHNMGDFGTDTVCTVCGYTEKQEQTTGGSFSIESGSSEPTGTLSVTKQGLTHHVVFTPDEGIKIDTIEWYLDDEKMTEAVYECDFETPESRTYTVMCVIYSDISGNSYDEKIYGGKNQ